MIDYCFHFYGFNQAHCCCYLRCCRTLISSFVARTKTRALTFFEGLDDLGGRWKSGLDGRTCRKSCQARTVQTICKNITAQRQGRQDRSLQRKGSREFFEMRYWMRWAASHIEMLVNYWWSLCFKLQTIECSGGFCVNKRMALFQLEIFRSVGRSRTASRSLSRTDKSLGIDPGQNNSGYSRDIRLLRSANALSIWGGFPFRTVQIMVILYKGPEMPSFLVLFWCIPASS